MALQAFIIIGSRFRRRHNRARRGIVAMEMALIAPVFFLVLMGVIETTLMMTAQQLIENAAFNVSRLGKTGYTATGKNQGQMVSQAMTSELQSYGNMIDTSKVTITQAAYNSFASINNGKGTSGYGTASQIVVYNITYPWKMFTPILNALVGSQGIVTLTSTIVVRNEPY